MTIWVLLALTNAFTHSVFNSFANFLVSFKKYSQYTVTIYATLCASAILFIASLIVGFPQIDPRFWQAVIITGIINGFATPIMFKAYQLGVFSSVYSKILLTPVFLLFTSFIFLGERPDFLGVVGVLVTILGLWIIAKQSGCKDAAPPLAESGAVVAPELNVKDPKNIKKAELLAVLVAFLWSISVNFDKLAVKYSGIFLAPAVGFMIVALMNIGYLLAIKRRDQLLPAQKFSRYLKHLVSAGSILGVSGVFHNAALLAGPAAYTIAIKRNAVIFGIIWSYFFFKERHLGRKLLGAVIAVAGVILILFE